MLLVAFNYPLLFLYYERLDLILFHIFFVDTRTESAARNREEHEQARTSTLSGPSQHPTISTDTGTIAGTDNSNSPLINEPGELNDNYTIDPIMPQLESFM